MKDTTEATEITAPINDEIKEVFLTLRADGLDPVTAAILTLADRIIDLEYQLHDDLEGIREAIVDKEIG